MSGIRSSSIFGDIYYYGILVPVLLVTPLAMVPDLMHLVTGSVFGASLSFKLFGEKYTLSVISERPGCPERWYVKVARLLAICISVNNGIGALIQRYRQAEGSRNHHFNAASVFMLYYFMNGSTGKSFLSKVFRIPIAAFALGGVLHLLDQAIPLVHRRGQLLMYAAYSGRSLYRTGHRTIVNFLHSHAVRTFVAERRITSPHQPLLDENLEIRIITNVRLDDQGIPDVCTEVVSLYNAPEYTAISYRCATKGMVEYVRLNGQLIRIDANGASLLRSPLIQERIRGTPLWLDCISINQNDLVEKSHQVQLMKSIYERAKSVLVWLREPDSRTSLALDQMLLLTGWYSSLIAIIDAQCRLDPSALTENIIRQAIEKERRLFLVETDNDDSEAIARWNAVKEFLEDPYFQRTWILQETSCGNSSNVEVIMGRQGETISYEKDLWNTVSHFKFPNHPKFDSHPDAIRLAEQLRIATHYQLIARCIRDIRLRRAWLAAHPVRHLLVRVLEGLSPIESEAELWSVDFMRVMLYFRQSESSDPVDKIFVPVGLILDRRYPDLAADYSLSTLTIYSRLVETAIRVQGDLSILGFVGDPCHDLPSWVPDWRRLSTITSLANLRNKRSQCIYRAGRNLPISAVIDQTRTQLAVKGVLIDALTNTDACLATLSESVDHDWETFCKIPTINEYDTSFAPLSREAFERVHCADSVSLMWLGRFSLAWGATKRFALFKQICIAMLRHIERSNVYNFLEKTNWYNFVRFDTDLAYFQRRGNRNRKVQVEQAEDEEMDYSRNVKRIHEYRQVRRLRGGRLLLCPLQAAKNDLVVIIAGGNVPVILRELKQESEISQRETPLYILIGEAYVDGFMDGEVVAEVESGRSRLQDFTLT